MRRYNVYSKWGYIYKYTMLILAIILLSWMCFYFRKSELVFNKYSGVQEESFEKLFLSIGTNLIVIINTIIQIIRDFLIWLDCRKK